MSVYALIMAAGDGKRMGYGVNKAMIPLRGVPMVRRTVEAFTGIVDGVAVVTRSEDINAIRALSPNIVIVEGGKTRQQSVLRGLNALPADAEYVLVHDAARPFVSAEVIQTCINSVKKHGSGVASIPLCDTIKQIKQGNGNTTVIRTPSRNGLRAAQTPQAFPVKALKRAIEALEYLGETASDDASAMEAAGHRVILVEGSEENRKITTPLDLEWAEWYLSKNKMIKNDTDDYNTTKCETMERDTIECDTMKDRANRYAMRSETSSCEIAQIETMSCKNERSEIARHLPWKDTQYEISRHRVGIGYDVHRLAEGRPLILCGVSIPYEKGLLGHSDADVALHALMDAMLGAAAMGDIGAHFSDRDPAYKGAASTDLLRQVVWMTRGKGFFTRQADITIVAERPRLSPYIDDMRARVAEILSVAVENINVKATTTEGLGFEGEGKGISAQAVVSVLYSAV